MENSFKPIQKFTLTKAPDYERLPEDAFVISVRATNGFFNIIYILLKGVAWVSALLSFCLFILAGGVVVKFLQGSQGSEAVDLYIAIGIVLFVFGFWWVHFKIGKLAESGSASITVVPNEGIKVDGKNIPFSEISRFYVNDNNLLLETNGHDVVILKPVEDDASVAVMRELISHSGSSFS